MCKSDFEMQPKVKKAFNSIEQLYLEIDMADPEEMNEMAASAMSTEKLSENLSSEQTEKLDVKLKTELGMSLASVDNYTIHTVASLFLVNSMNCTETKSYEFEFIEMAEMNDIPVDGLEKVSFQITCLDNAFSLDRVFNDLFDPESEALMDSLVHYYKNEDLGGLSAIFSGDRYLDETSREWLLTKRNSNWVEVMPKLMKKKPTFFAVGAAHLLGDNGILTLLKQQGYTITPIFE